MIRVLASVLDPRQRSLLRANLLVLLSFFGAIFLSDFPQIKANPLLILPAVLSIVGTADTVRNIRRRWSLYHGGVLFCLYMDLMAISMILFFLFYPYGLWLSAAH